MIGNSGCSRTRKGAKILEPPGGLERRRASGALFCLFARGRSDCSFARAGIVAECDAIWKGEVEVGDGKLRNKVGPRSAVFYLH